MSGHVPSAEPLEPQGPRDGAKGVYTAPSDLHWNIWPWRRCRARMEPRSNFPFFGRCDLDKHGVGEAHALERGAEVWRWRTDPEHVHIFGSP